LLEKCIFGAFHSFQGVDVFPVHTEPAVQQNRTFFLNAVEDNVDEFLESHSLRLANEKLADLDNHTYKETKGDEADKRHCDFI
jgi:hypothetical protein